MVNNRIISNFFWIKLYSKYVLFSQQTSSLEEAKQLLIQQKLELQGKLEGSTTALQQEKKLQQTLKDEMKRKEDEWKKQHIELQNKLVSHQCP